MGWCETNIAGFMTAFPVCVFYIILSLSSQIAMTWQNLRHFDCLQVASWDPFDLIESPGHEIISLSTVTSHNTSQVVTLVTHPATGKIKEGNTAQFQEGRYSYVIKNYCLTIALKTEDWGLSSAAEIVLTSRRRFSNVQIPDFRNVRCISWQSEAWQSGHCQSQWLIVSQISTVSAEII